MDVTALELSLLKILEADPKAVVNVILRLDMPSWWLRQNPDECFVWDQGKRSAQSFFSLRWRQDIAAAMQILKCEMDILPAARRIGGVVLSGGEGGEMLLPGRTYGEYDVSPAARRAFAAWCEQNKIAPPDFPHPAMQRPYAMDEAGKAARRAIFRFLADWQGDNMVPVDSILLRGLTHLNENDIRTHLVKDADIAGRPAADLNQTRELYRREMLNAAQKGLAMRYHALLHDVDFLQDLQLLQFIGELGREVQTLKPLKLGDKNQVAFVIDDEALFDLTSLSTWETLPPLLLSQARDALARMDRPVAWLLWSDWVQHKDKFKTAIFPLPSLLSMPHRTQLAAWAQSTLPALNDDSDALVADKTGAPSLRVFTELNDLMRAVGGVGSGAGTPVRYIGENFRFDYADGQFTAR